MTVIIRNSGATVFDTIAIALTYNLRVGQVCIVKGNLTATDGLGAQYEVRAAGSGGFTMSNGNELYILDGETIKPASVANLFGLTGVAGQQISVGEYNAGSNVGNFKAKYRTDLARTVHDGVRYHSPSRNLTTEGLTAYLVASTDAALGVWENIETELTVAMAGATTGVNASPSFNAALVVDGVNTILAIGATDGYTLDDDVTVPLGKALKGDYELPDPRVATDLETFNNRIILNSAASIILSESGAFSHSVILRKGMVLPANAAEVALFAGTAIKTTSGAHGVYVGYSHIVGFTSALVTDISNTPQVRCEYLNIDCTNGLNITQALDVSYISYVHCWPSASVNVAGLVDADLQRAGAAFTLKDGGDWAKLSFCFTFGYARGFVLDAVNSVTLDGCASDYTVTQTANPIGVEVKNSCAEPRVINYQAAGQNIGILLNSTSTLSHATISGLNTWECDTAGVSISNGEAHINQANIRGGTGSGIVHNTAKALMLDNVNFQSITGNAINNVSPSNVLRNNNSTYSGVTGVNVASPYVATTASSGGIVTLNGTDKTWVITSVVAINTINNAADYAGETIKLIFTTALTVVDGSNLKLAGNFVTTADDTLNLTSDGTNWYEDSRSIN